MREDNERNEEGGRDRMGGGVKDLTPQRGRRIQGSRKNRGNGVKW